MGFCELPVAAFVRAKGPCRRRCRCRCLCRRLWEATSSTEEVSLSSSSSSVLVVSQRSTALCRSPNEVAGRIQKLLPTAPSGFTTKTLSCDGGGLTHTTTISSSSLICSAIIWVCGARTKSKRSSIIFVPLSCLYLSCCRKVEVHKEYVARAKAEPGAGTYESARVSRQTAKVGMVNTTPSIIERRQ